MRAAVLVLAACSSAPAAPDAAAPDARPLPTELPSRLSEVGVYADLATKTLASDALAYTPRNVLWSDGADKERWIQLPAGAQIDTTDMDHWRFPVGTKLVKQFSLDGKRLETRVLWRVGDTGDRERDTLLGAYVWADDESDAVFVKAGQDNLRGTPHDAPSADACWRCHLGEPGQVLGFSALQLASLDGLPLSVAPTGTYGAPDAAQGYLHANCGHCHSPDGPAWQDSHMVLRLGVGEHDAKTTQLVKSTVGVALEQWIGRGFTDRIVAGDPDQSAIAYRMGDRTVNVEMPPLATELVDEVGLAMIRSWIQRQ